MTLLGTARTRTTSYHPQANGLVERFHRQLKGALKAQALKHSWAESLPLVLLGIRTAVKEDLQCSVAELVYGTTLRLPGEFFSPASCLQVDSDYVGKLKNYMSKLRATPPRVHRSHGTYCCLHFTWIIRENLCDHTLQPHPTNCIVLSLKTDNRLQK